MRKSKPEILAELKQSFAELEKACLCVPQDMFNRSVDNKWTAAENLQHIIISTKFTAFAFRLPKFVPLLLYARPGRTSHGFSKVIDNYQKKLQAGGKATGVYVPKVTTYNRSELLVKLQQQAYTLQQAIEQKWADEDLDHYQVAHPLLGLLTHRELAYFTIYHTRHHAETVIKLYGKANSK